MAAASSPIIDPIELSQRLVQCRSVTPDEGGALDLLQEILEPLGFTCHRLLFSEPGTADVDNLYARWGTTGRNFCFAGHTDVVPVGDATAWQHDPFAGTIADGYLWGRGISDMKGAIAAMVAAMSHIIADSAQTAAPGSLSLLITGDEEGPAINGTRKVLDWLVQRGEIVDDCVVGEPTNPQHLGEMLKIGRRGSVKGHLVVRGVQGHSAYPHLADNPVHKLVDMLAAVTHEPLDQGSEFFPPSSLQVTSVDVGNGAINVIPAQAEARMDVRFTDHYSAAQVIAWLRQRFDRVSTDYQFHTQISGESFLTPPGPLSQLVSTAVAEVTGRQPEASTTGGTSDARFIKDICPVVEFGLTNATAHKVDECARISDLKNLTAIYQRILAGYFSKGS